MWSTKNRSVSTKETLGTPTSLELQTSSSRMVHSAFCYANVMEPVFSLSINVVWTLTLLSWLLHHFSAKVCSVLLSHNFCTGYWTSLRLLFSLFISEWIVIAY
jgi:hypothetical protein